MCFSKTAGDNDIQQFFNTEDFSSLLNPDEPRIGLSELKILQENNYLSCSFKRKKIIDAENYFDLSKKYYLLIAKGDAFFQSNILIINPNFKTNFIILFFQDSDSYPDYHGNNRLFSSEEIDFSTTDSVEISTSPFKLVKAHGN